MNDTNRSPPRRPSGRFVLRLDPGVHAALREAASAAGVSLNEYCARKLAAPGVQVAGPATEAVSRALAQSGANVIGIVAFGSWARGEQTPRSDVDLLVVLDGRATISRGLYRPWDASPVYWRGHVLEPHFVRLPDPDARLSGLWAEVAVEGIILFDRELRVSRRLAALRRRIVESGLVRRRAHGQPYWVEAA